MIPRTLEPEVMDSTVEAEDYDAMDHGDVNRIFVDDFLAAVGSLADGDDDGPRLLDVGTGTAQIPIELCRRNIPGHITAIDLAGEMLKVARRNVAEVGFESQISLERVDAKALPYGEGAFDAVLSNSIVHHIPEPRVVLEEMLRVLKPGGLLFVRDLLRPETAEAVDQLVATYAGGENPHQRQMFHDSLHAALTVAEMQELLASLGRSGDWVTQTSDRHWTLVGRA